jgi:triosephosphate isomerase
MAAWLPTRRLSRCLLAGLNNPGCDVAVVCLRPIWPGAGAGRTGPIDVGAQDVSQHESGAFTGEVSAAMLKEFGVRYAIVGHSERRQYHGESDAVVALKAQRAWPAA